MTLLLTKGAFLSDTDILFERLKKEEEESDKEHIMIYFDVDEFKTFNDHFGGRGAGDRIILEIARLLKSIFRIDDLKARISGDEFAVLVPYINFDNSLAVLKRAMEKLYTQAPTANYDGKEKKATFSIVAVTISPKEAKKGVTAEQIMLEADKKSKLVKETGKSGFLIMSADPNGSEQSVLLGRFDPTTQQFSYQREQISTLESMRQPNIRA
jgi:diguanylate cyclase (GGDEF)-like protein